MVVCGIKIYYNILNVTRGGMRNVGYDSHVKSLLKTCVELEECEDFYECVEFLNQGFRNRSLRYRIAGAGEDNSYHEYLKSMSHEYFHKYIVIPVLKELYPRSTEVEHALEQTSMVCMDKVPRAREHPARPGLNILKSCGGLWLLACVVNLLAASVALENQGAGSDTIYYWWLGSALVAGVSSCIACANIGDLNRLQLRIENQEELEQSRINRLYPYKLAPISEIYLEDGGALRQGYEIGDGSGGGGGGGGATFTAEEIAQHADMIEMEGADGIESKSVGSYLESVMADLSGERGEAVSPGAFSILVCSSSSSENLRPRAL